MLPQMSLPHFPTILGLHEIIKWLFLYNLHNVLAHSSTVTLLIFMNPREIRTAWFSERPPCLAFHHQKSNKITSEQLSERT